MHFHASWITFYARTNLYFHYIIGEDASIEKTQNKISLVTLAKEYLRGKYHCTIYLLFDWFGLVCFANKIKKFLLSHS
jgi:hypothetical protein